MEEPSTLSAMLMCGAKTCPHYDIYIDIVEAKTVDFKDVNLSDNGRPLSYINGNARIIRATLPSRTNQVGIKCIPKKSGEEEYKRQCRALERELAVWCYLNNPNTLPLSGIVTLDHGFNIFMSPSAIFDFYGHGDITMYIRSHHKPDELDRARLVSDDTGLHRVQDDDYYGLFGPRCYQLYDVTKGLAYIHSQGIVHGDIKTANVVIDPTSRAQICDFGSAHVLKCSGCIAGPPIQFYSLKSQLYLSPELSMDGDRDPPTTQASDVWALGCAMLEVQVGRLPYSDENGRYVERLAMQRQAAGEMPAGEEAFPPNTISHAIGLVALECWIEDPGDRPTAQDVLDMLREAFRSFDVPL
ncbi:ephrin receptor [Rhizoctonia solani]|uniref:Ephrin receptor n=1 Tax=Rhizoctonia solani TaxID=456999 RepID=A0A8H7H4D5_9AGAM|nr:ephrin receptor [Rhizoctonia solani]